MAGQAQPDCACTLPDEIANTAITARLKRERNISSFLRHRSRKNPTNVVVRILWRPLVGVGETRPLKRVFVSRVSFFVITRIPHVCQDASVPAQPNLSTHRPNGWNGQSPLWMHYNRHRSIRHHQILQRKPKDFVQGKKHGECRK